MTKLGCGVTVLILGVVLCGFYYEFARDGLSSGDYVLAFIIFGAVGFIYADLTRKKGQ